MKRRWALALLLVLVGCDTTPESEPAPPSTSAAPVTVTTMPTDRAAWPWLRTRLPRGVPTDLAPLTRLLVDPPGRVTSVYHPPEHWPEPLEGWASETLVFHGVDGRWRVLTLDELGLDDRSWVGHDTYGAGSLSPDGRWWAGRSRAGVILLDLGTGRSETVRLGSRWTASISWRADSRALVVGHGLRVRTEMVELQGGRRTVLPYRYWEGALDPDDRSVSARVREPGVLEVSRRTGGRWVIVGTAAVPGARPARHGSGRVGPSFTGDRMLVSITGRRRADLLVLDRVSLTVEARLRLGRSDRRAYLASRWLDARTVLITTRDGLVAWRPADGTFLRVTGVPRTGNGIDGYSTLDVATGPAGR